MRPRVLRACLLGILLVLAAPLLHAESLLMARVPLDFPEAMLNLQSTITEHGYTVSRVQRVDIGLTSSGFATDKYRIVFFAKPAELRALSARYVELLPYLPLKLTIFAEKDETLIVTTNPAIYKAIVSDPALHLIFERWSADIHSMLEQLRRIEP